MDNAVRRMHDEFVAFFPRSPEIRAVVSGEGVWRWVRDHVDPRQPMPSFGGLGLVAASYGGDPGGSAEFVAIREAEEITVPTEALRDLITALQEIPDAAQLLVGSEIILSFSPGTPR